MTAPIRDLAIIGGGIVGLATGMEILNRRPDVRVTLLEKEPQVAAHQTAHNSGVIHSGIYYRPGSLKARTCLTGARLLVEFCQAHRIPYEVCGKVIVAADGSQVPALDALYQRGIANGLAGVSMVGPERLRELEPHARGVRALHVPSAGVVDYTKVARAFAEAIRRLGGEIRTATRVERLFRRERQWVLETSAGEIRSAYLVTCGGLFADRIAAMAGAPNDLRIIPFRGEYYEVVPARRFLVNRMIYPVPDPAVPFLGVHLTRSVSGSVHAGPNAVLALAREGYRKRDVHLGDTLRMLGFPGFWRMASRHWKTGALEWARSMSKAAFVRALQRLVPDVRANDLVPGDRGVRAQAVDVRGTLVDDFDIVQGEGAIYVRNVPSPAATASIRIGQILAAQIASAFSGTP